MSKTNKKEKRDAKPNPDSKLTDFESKVSEPTLYRPSWVKPFNSENDRYSYINYVIIRFREHFRPELEELHRTIMKYHHFVGHADLVENTLNPVLWEIAYEIDRAPDTHKTINFYSKPEMFWGSMENLMLTYCEGSQDEYIRRSIKAVGEEILEIVAKEDAKNDANHQAMLHEIERQKILDSMSFFRFFLFKVFGIDRKAVTNPNSCNQR